MSLSEKLNNISDQEIEQVLPEVIQYFQSSINFLAYKTYHSTSLVAKSAFLQLATHTLKKALSSFIEKGYQKSRNPLSYLKSSLNNLSISTYNDVNKIKKKSVLICPLCKYLDGNNYFLVYDSDKKLQRCDNCFKSIDQLQLQAELSISDQEKIKLHQHFSYHSRKGYRCTGCQHFIPHSFASSQEIACPYPKCQFFGKISDLLPMIHPMTLIVSNLISLDDSPSHSENKDLKIADAISDQKIIPVDCSLVFDQQLNKEHSILSNVIQQQLEKAANKNHTITGWHNFVMYQAFQKMLGVFPVEMVNYLVKLKSISDFPLQSKIFQQYVALVENSLPISFSRYGETTEILSLLDPILDIFEGKSVFQARVDGDIIHNLTVETYTGLRQFNNFGRCFIGLLLDVKHRDTYVSLKNNVINYSFSEIKVQQLAHDTPVIVEHLRIPSHYEIKSLAYLQKVRKQIVDKVFFQLNGIKRNQKGIDES